MKRLISVVLAAVMSLAMVTTAFADTAASEVLGATIEKNNALDSMDADVMVRASLYQGRESIDMIMQTNIKMDHLTSGDMRYLMDAFMVLGMTGEESITGNATMFYKDGYYYVDVMDVKMKYPMPLNTMMETAKQTNGTQFDPTQFKNIQMRQEGENLVLSYEADTAKMNEMISQMLGSMLSAEDMQVNIKSVSGEYTVNPEGYYTAFNIVMAMDLTSDGETISMIMDMDGTVNNPGQPVYIQFPSTDGYESLFSYTGAAGSGRGPASDY